jgi:hypothetical protein
MRHHAATALLLHAVCASLSRCVAQPPWLPWRIEHQNAVSGRSNLDSPHVWVAGRTPTMAACQSLCANNKTCNSFDWAGADSEDYPCSAALSCYFRSDRVFDPKHNDKCNHTCGTRIKPDGPPPAGPPTRAATSPAAASDAPAARAPAKYCVHPHGRPVSARPSVASRLAPAALRVLMAGLLLPAQGPDARARGLHAPWISGDYAHGAPRAD